MFARSLICLRVFPRSISRQFHLSPSIRTVDQRAFNLARPNKKDRIDIGAILLLFIPVTTFALGSWQVSRRRRKINLINFLKSRTQAEPISLLDNLDRLPEYEYYPIRVRGKFDHSREILVEPRARLDDQSTDQRVSSRTSASGGQNFGAQVVTPFRVANRNFDILVNRGFVPQEFKDPSTRKAGQIEEEHEIIGLLRTTDYLNWSKNEPEKNVWRTRDVPEMAAALNTAPIFLDEMKSTSVPGGPIGGQTNVQLRNEHTSYIITWFSLSAFTSFMWLRKYVL